MNFYYRNPILNRTSPLWKTNRTPVKNWYWNNTTPAQIQPHLDHKPHFGISLRTEDRADFEIYGMKFSTSWFCVGNQKIEMFLTYDGHLGGFGGHFGHFLDHFGEPIQNKGVFCSKRKSPVFPCLGWGMTLMTWQSKNIKFWKNLVPFKHMFTVKMCVFWPFFCILKPMIGGQKKRSRPRWSSIWLQNPIPAFKNEYMKHWNHFER